MITLRPNLVCNSTGLKYLTSLGLKNIYLTTAFFLCTFKGYPVNIILFNIIVNGLGGKTCPYPTNLRVLSSLDEENNSILDGANTIGQ